VRRVVIIGAGAAGVFTAYRLRQLRGDVFEIVLLEQSDRIGGNALATNVTVGGRTYSIDCGAQFFAAKPQSSYVRLIADLGLTEPPSAIEARATGLSLWDAAAGKRRLWIPAQAGGFLRYHSDDWTRLVQFATFLIYAYLLDRDRHSNWTLSVDDWLRDLSLLGSEFKDEVVRLLLYQFVTLPADRIGEASARYAITYFVRTAFGEPGLDDPSPPLDSAPGFPTFQVLQSRIGLDGILQRALTAAGVTPRLNEPVVSVSQAADGTPRVTTTARTIPADDVVFAIDPQSAAATLAVGAFPAPALIAALQQCEYDTLSIALQHGAPCWMPGDTSDWEAVNTIADGSALRFSVWFGPLRDRLAGGEAIPVFKSWATPDLDPAACASTFFSHAHRILMPTTTFMAKREEVRSHQGKQRLWFAGGWTTWFDSQEAALDSATDVAVRLAAPPAAMRHLVAPAAFDYDRHRARIDRWLARVAASAPVDRRAELRRLLDRVEAQG
jgi:predicted NAD/FAD-binding protein